MSQRMAILKRRRVLPILGTALVAIVSVGALGQATQVGQRTVRYPDHPSPYDNSKADRALKEFAEEHPNCPLWTNWHKLCSRTGPDGTAYCRLDRVHHASASTPFCAAMNGQLETNHADYNEKSQYQSSIRFSKIRSVKEIIFEGNSSKSHIRNIRSWSADRPFNGRSFWQYEDPGCEIWWYPDPDLGPVTCSTNPHAGMPQCKDTKINDLSFSAEHPSCISWKEDSWCAKTEAKLRHELPKDRTGERAPIFSSSANEIVQNARRLDSSPVTSEFCR